MISLRYSLIPSSILYPRNNFFHLVLSIHTSIPKSDDKSNMKYNFVLSNGLFHRKHNQSSTICIMKNSSISITENNTCLRNDDETIRCQIFSWSDFLFIFLLSVKILSCAYQQHFCKIEINVAWCFLWNKK